MAELTIQQEHLDMARKAGACDSGLRYAIGTPLSGLSASHAKWFEQQFPELSATLVKEAVKAAGIAVRGVIGLAFFSGSGSGSGYGDGDGYGDGSGYGDGDGYGYGGGSGDGYGYGYGYGDGYDDGDGYGYGYGDGNKDIVSA